MMGIPVAIIGSLLAALLLTKNLNGVGSLRRIHFIAVGVLFISLCLLYLTGFAFGGMKFMIALLFGGILVARFTRPIHGVPHLVLCTSL